MTFLFSFFYIKLNQYALIKITQDKKKKRNKEIFGVLARRKCQSAEGC